MEAFEGTLSADELEEADRLRRRRERLSHPRFLILLNLGLILTALGIVIFKTPNHFALGGTSGISIILATLFPALPVGGFMWVVNIALVALGLAMLDRRTMGWTVFSSLALSAYVTVLELLIPLAAPLTNDTLLELIFAVMLPAIGSAIVFNIGASTGGTDILAMILRKRTSLEIGKALLVVDAAIVAVAFVLYGPRTGLYCVLGLLAKALVVDTFIEGINTRKVVTVISSKPDEVMGYIVHDLHRTATIRDERGGFSGRDLTVLVSVLTRREAAKLRDHVRSIDPGAFITIMSSSEIIGRGFRSG